MIQLMLPDSYLYKIHLFQIYHMTVFLNLPTDCLNFILFLQMHTVLHMISRIVSRSTSSSVLAPSLMDRKKNGLEQNKLHLNLSLGNANRIQFVYTNAPWNNLSEIMASESESDNIAIQNPPDLRHFNSMNARNEILV